MNRIYSTLERITHFLYFLCRTGQNGAHLTENSFKRGSRKFYRNRCNFMRLMHIRNMDDGGRAEHDCREVGIFLILVCVC